MYWRYWRNAKHLENVCQLRFHPGEIIPSSIDLASIVEDWLIVQGAREDTTRIRAYHRTRYVRTQLSSCVKRKRLDFQACRNVSSKRVSSEKFHVDVANRRINRETPVPRVRIAKQQPERYDMSTQQSPAALQQTVDREKVYTWIIELSNPETRENALLELSKKREVVPDLAPMLWHSFGTTASLLQEIINIYPAINPATLTAYQSNRVCNALALLQCVASHPETRSAFLQAHVPLFLYPFLHTVSKTRPFEYLRLTSLGVIGALVKTDEQEVITFLLTTEIIPLCLRIMESGSELSKTVATFILQKILLDDSGLSYICQTYDRFSHVAMILGKMVLSLAKDPSARLLKHVVRCYLRLSDNARALLALRQCLPDQLRDNTFATCLQEDASTKHWLNLLLKNLEAGPQQGPPTQPGQQDPRTIGMSPLTS